jgi:integrase/ribosomal protein L40E
MNDLYDCGRRLEAARKRLSTLPYAELLLAFLDHLKALGLSDNRVLKYANSLSTIFKNTPFNPSGATKQDVERAVAWINVQPYKSWTKHGLKLALKRLVQYAKHGSCDAKTPIPPEVDWIPMRVDERDNRVKPETLLTADEVKALMASAENERDRAMLSIMYEAALRPGELLTMTVRSVQFKDEYCLITVTGKTGVKCIPLVISFKPLLEWLQKHPRRDDPDAPLWASFANNAKGEGISYYYLRKLLKKLAAKAGIKRDLWPYLFRHTALTNLAKVFSEARLEQYAGWVHGSKMSRRYVHFSARDLETAVLELHGLRKADNAEGIFKVEKCLRCGRINPPDNVRCGFCGFILDEQLAVKMEEEERRRDEAIIARIERLEQLVRSLLESSSSIMYRLKILCHHPEVRAYRDYQKRR